MKAQEKVHDWATGSHKPSHVEGCRIPAWAEPISGLPESTNRFHSGARPLAAASRTAARQGRFAKARSERIGLAGSPTCCCAARRFQGSKRK